MISSVNWWPAVVFGWPSILTAIALSVLGIARRSPGTLGASAVLATPFSLYLGGSPRIGWLGLMMPVLLLGAGIAARYQLVWMALLLVVPVLAVVGWVATLVLWE
jgi:hypothetical protein